MENVILLTFHHDFDHSTLLNHEYYKHFSTINDLPTTTTGMIGKLFKTKQTMSDK